MVTGRHLTMGRDQASASAMSTPSECPAVLRMRLDKPRTSDGPRHASAIPADSPSGSTILRGQLATSRHSPCHHLVHSLTSGQPEGVWVAAIIGLDRRGGAMRVGRSLSAAGYGVAGRWRESTLLSENVTRVARGCCAKGARGPNLERHLIRRPHESEHAFPRRSGTIHRHQSGNDQMQRMPSG